MVAFLVVCWVLSMVSALIMVAFRAKGRSAAVDREVQRERLTARAFSGVIISNERAAHAFDAGYSALVKVRCDDGSILVLDLSIFAQNRFPVGMRIVKQAGQSILAAEITAAPDEPAPTPVEDSGA